MINPLIGFASGFAFGATSATVGQPFDTIKTRMQAQPSLDSKGSIWVGTDLFRRHGIPGLYRGFMPMILGGAMFRSAQFGFFTTTQTFLQKIWPETYKIGGFLDVQTVAAGFMGGFGRGLLESPFEYIKVRKQVNKKWQFGQLYTGSGATMFRNAFLFSSFVIYIDFSNQLIEGGLSPFWKGAICANLAWFTVWPLDVVKSQVQSGHYSNRSFGYLLYDTISSGKLFRGLGPGLVRSTIANGCSMVAYEKVSIFLKKQFDQE